MIRRHFTIPCAGAQLAATLDLPASGAPTSALLLVSGGNEIRAGAFAGQARLAARITAAGHAVLRFDRRGVGDSSGENAGFRHSAEDIAAALAALRAAVPGLCYIVAFGNCDGASALMLAGGAGVNALVLANPWTIEQEDEAAPAPPAALRAHYRARLANPAAIRRLLTGQVAPMALLRSLAAMARPRAPSTNSLAAAMAEGLARFTGPVRILLAGRDRTAQAFLGLWNRKDQRLAHCPGASHAFVEAEAREWLLEQILAALAP